MRSLEEIGENERVVSSGGKGLVSYENAAGNGNKRINVHESELGAKHWRQLNMCLNFKPFVTSASDT